MIGRVDEFILLDNVQYTRRDWRNRNRIKTPRGPAWLTIPVKTKGNYASPIDAIEVASDEWAASHWERLKQCYRKTPNFHELAPRVRELYLSCSGNRLSEINLHFLRGICQILGIDTKMTYAAEYNVASIDRNMRLVDLCLASGAKVYVSGPSAKAYIDLNLFREAEIEVRFMVYGGYPEYCQPYPPFLHEVSILDLLLCTGKEARQYVFGELRMKEGQK